MSIDQIAAEVRAKKEARLAQEAEKKRAERIAKKEAAKRNALIEAFLIVNIIE